MLQSLNVKFSTISIDIDEVINSKKTPIFNVKNIARQKCEEAFNKINGNGIVITADTIVVLNNKIIGKPKNADDAKNILKKLSGKSHFVYTGFALGNSKTKKIITDYEKTEVTFYDLTSKQIKEYIETGSPLDKAGAYGIQDDYGALFVRKINGCYYNVVGFPIAKIFRTLEKIK